ncbi:VQ motif-containing protein 9 [Argentina anserina]|uniref:VQ motif-containing protein 9 n=1 Tax=Argentina anserina TaxID=57926 RepID=UPI0021764D23|nr:VQ motif-containing protein 9 [Potentilla anserina]
MDKTSSSSTELTSNTTRDQYLKHLNKLSHKISKPVTRKPNFDPPPPVVPAPNPQNAPLSQPPNQHQPPVYNINKNDFRDVVQKLTGSPAHADRFATPPPIHPPKTQSSRLQRIRPPPLATRPPPPLLDGAVSAQSNNVNNNPLIPPMGTAAAHFGRSAAPLSPLPPFPTVHGAAESPVSAYMRYLHNSLSGGDSNPNMSQKQQHFSGFSPLAPLVSPRWTNLTPPPPQPEQNQSQNQQNQNQNENNNQQLPQPEQGMTQSSETLQPPPPPASSQPQFTMPPSPLPFGCLNSPLSQYGLLSPTQLGFPLSPTVPAPSPRWKGL